MICQNNSFFLLTICSFRKQKSAFFEAQMHLSPVLFSYAIYQTGYDILKEVDTEYKENEKKLEGEQLHYDHFKEIKYSKIKFTYFIGIYSLV